MTSESDFQPWPKIPRLAKETMIITEKIDGTNAHVYISDDLTTIKAASRNRWITPESDNYGFASWVEANKTELLKLGRGRHYGEWWGQGIQRGYGLTEKRFSLFNTARPKETLPACVSQVPVLCIAQVDTWQINAALSLLINEGSHAAPGYMNPEGIVVFYPSLGKMHKVLVENNDKHKGEIEAA
jgi:hypothetical protein